MQLSLRVVGGKGIRRGEGVQTITLRMTEKELQRIAAAQKKIKQQTGVCISRSYLLREGSRLLLLKLMRELTKANSGSLHAKKRKDINENQTEKETVSVGGSRREAIRRRR